MQSLLLNPSLVFVMMHWPHLIVPLSQMDGEMNWRDELYNVLAISPHLRLEFE